MFFFFFRHLLGFHFYRVALKNGYEVFFRFPLYLNMSHKEGEEVYFIWRNMDLFCKDSPSLCASTIAYLSDPGFIRLQIWLFLLLDLFLRFST